MPPRGITKYDVKKTKFRGSYSNGDWKEPWKSFNPNCAKCKYRNDERTWASVGTCNYAFVTGEVRIKKYKAADCPGFPGKRIVKKTKCVRI